jgi:hypothetical protein
MVYYTAVIQTNNQRKPSAMPNLTISQEHKLAVWLKKQERDYINGTGEVTHNPSIRAAWLEFISDPRYSKYLRVKAPNN